MAEVWHPLAARRTQAGWNDGRRRLAPGFFDRQDRGDDADFYVPLRLVTHIDDGAIAAVSELYDELGVPDGRVLDLMSFCVSHLSRRPSGGLVALGMNAVELQANPVADQVVVQDLNLDPRLAFDDASFDAVLCCVSIDYLIHPVEVLREAARVVSIDQTGGGPTWHYAGMDWASGCLTWEVSWIVGWSTRSGPPPRHRHTDINEAPVDHLGQHRGCGWHTFRGARRHGLGDPRRR